MFLSAPDNRAAATATGRSMTAAGATATTSTSTIQPSRGGGANQYQQG